MTLPTRKQQVDAVAKLLDSDHMEGRSLDEIASMIVDGYHSLITSKLKTPAAPPRPGMLFKTPLDGRVRRFQWEGEGLVWIVGETDSYGWLGAPGALFKWCEEYRPKRRRDGKMVELTDEEIAEEWSNPDWKAGEKVSQHQRQFSFEIIATAPQSVLMRGNGGQLYVDGNANLKKYYRRESGVSDEW